MGQVIYISEYANYDPLRPDGTSIVKLGSKTGFNAYPVLDPQRGVVTKGVLVLDAERYADMVKELESFPDFGKGFVRVNKLPTRVNSEGNIISGVRTGHEEIKIPVVDSEQIKKEIGDKFKRLIELRKKILNPNGSIKKTVLPEEITELENLEKELFPKEE